MAPPLHQKQMNNVRLINMLIICLLFIPICAQIDNQIPHLMNDMGFLAQIDDTSHFFFHCPNVRHLWYLFFQMWNGTEYHRVNFPNYPDVYDILFGIKNMNDGHEVLNFCILHIKYYIYKQRLFHNTLSIREICNKIRYKLDIERKIYENDDKQMNFGKYISLYDMLNSL